MFLWEASKVLTVATFPFMVGTVPSFINSISGLINTLQNSEHVAPQFQQTLHRMDIPHRIKTIQAVLTEINNKDNAVGLAANAIAETIHEIHKLLRNIADKKATHENGYITRWRTLNLNKEQTQLQNLNTMLTSRFLLLQAAIQCSTTIKKSTTC